MSTEVDQERLSGETLNNATIATAIAERKRAEVAGAKVTWTSAEIP